MKSKVNITESKGYFLVSLKNMSKINILNSNKIESNVTRIIEISEKPIYLDLQEIEFIDSKGFNVLLKLKRLAYLNNINFIIKNISKEIFELFDLLGLRNEFQISNNVTCYTSIKKAS